MSEYAVPSSSSAAPSPAAGARPEERVVMRRLLWVGPLAVVVAIVVNLVIWLLTEALFPIAPEFLPQDAPPIIFFTTVGMIGAVVVFALLARFTRRPITIFRWVALVALLLSLVPNVLLLIDSSGAPFGGATAPAIWSLMLMHVAAAGVAVGTLTTFTREPR